MNVFLDFGETLQRPKGAYTASQGHWRVDANVTRAGVLQYVMPTADGGYELANVLRHPDQVFHPKSLESLAGVPITLSHPVVDGAPVLVTPENFKTYGHGVVGDRISVANNPYVTIEGLNVQSAEAHRALLDGNKQLSPGYAAKAVPEEGTFNGIPYKYRQYGLSGAELEALGIRIDGYSDDDAFIVYNHLAVMKPGEYGRSGESVKVLNLDSCWIQADSASEPAPAKSETQIFDIKPRGSMTKRTITLTGDSNTHYQVDEGGMVTVPVEKLQEIMSQLNELLALQTEVGTAVQATAMDSVSSLADAFNKLKGEKAIVDSELSKRVDPAQLAEMVKKRVRIESVARPVLGDKFSADSTDEDLMKQVIAKYDPNMSTDGISTAEVSGMFNAVSRILAQSSSSTKAAAETITDSDDKNPPAITTDADARLNAVRDKMRANYRRTPVAK